MEMNQSHLIPREIFRYAITADSKNPRGVLSFPSYLQTKITPFVFEFLQPDIAADLLAEFIVVLAM